MNHLYCFIALILVAGCTSPTTLEEQVLSQTEQAEILRLVPDADLSNITMSQAAALSSILSEKTYQQKKSKGGAIRAILN